MSTCCVISIDDVVDTALGLLETIQNKPELPERGTDLWEELLGFCQTLNIFENGIENSEIQAYLVNCCDLCIQLRVQEDWNSDVVMTRVPITIHMLRICRTAVLINVFWRLLHNTTVTETALMGFKSAIQGFLASLNDIPRLEKLENTPIKPPSPSLISHFTSMSAFAFNSISMMEFNASTSQTIICTPNDAFSLSEAEAYNQKMENIVLKRKSAVMLKDYQTPVPQLPAFLKELAASGKSKIRMERTFIFTDMNLLRSDSVFFCTGIYLTNDLSVESRGISSALPIAVVDGSKILEQSIEEDGNEEEKQTCGICLAKPARGENISILWCKHWYHQECISQWFTTIKEKVCPMCRKLS